MVFYHVSTIYYDCNGMQHTKDLDKIMSLDAVKAAVKNWDRVCAKRDPAFIHNLVIDLDAAAVIQVGGWSYDDGMFCDII